MEESYEGDGVWVHSVAGDVKVCKYCDYNKECSANSNRGFFSSGFSVTNIHDLQGSKSNGWLSI